MTTTIYPFAQFGRKASELIAGGGRCVTRFIGFLALLVAFTFSGQVQAQDFPKRPGYWTFDAAFGARYSFPESVQCDALRVIVDTFYLPQGDPADWFYFDPAVFRDGCRLRGGVPHRVEVTHVVDGQEVARFDFVFGYTSTGAFDFDRTENHVPLEHSAVPVAQFQDWWEGRRKDPPWADGVALNGNARDEHEFGASVQRYQVTGEGRQAAPLGKYVFSDNALQVVAPEPIAQLARRGHFESVRLAHPWMRIATMMLEQGRREAPKHFRQEIRDKVAYHLGSETGRAEFYRLVAAMMENRSWNGARLAALFRNNGVDVMTAGQTGGEAFVDAPPTALMVTKAVTDHMQSVGCRTLPLLIANDDVDPGLGGFFASAYMSWEADRCVMSSPGGRLKLSIGGVEIKECRGADYKYDCLVKPYFGCRLENIAGNAPLAESLLCYFYQAGSVFKRWSFVQSARTGTLTATFVGHE